MLTKSFTSKFELSLTREQHGAVAHLAVKKGMAMTEAVKEIFLDGLCRHNAHEVPFGRSGVGSRNASQPPRGADVCRAERLAA